MSGIDMLNVPENLDEMNGTIRSSAVKTFSGLDMTLKTNGTYRLILKERSSDQNAVGRLRQYLDKNEDVTLFVATASEQSGGKSTASNVILNYPLLPEAEQATTACATEICYGDEPSVQIRYYAKQQGAEEFIDGPLFRYNRQHRIDTEIWNALKEFACRCITYNVIFLENLQYFSNIHMDDKDPGNFSIDNLDMSQDDPRHVTLLLLYLFSTYVGQNEASLSPERKALCEFREDLLRRLGVDMNRDFAVRVRWDSKVLKQGLSLVDLPGLGSSAGEKIMPDGTTRRSHDRISIEYMNIVDAMFLFFGPEVKGASVSEVLTAFLETERFKEDVVSKNSRVIPVMNKADYAKAMQTGLKTARDILGDLNPAFICPISAISGEYQFVRDGLFPIERTKRYNNDLQGREHIRKRYLKRKGQEPSEEYICGEVKDDLQEAYETSYSFRDIAGNEYELTLAQWVKMMTTDYLARLRSLKTLELLYVGMYAEKQVSASIDMRIAALSMLHQGGSNMGKVLAEQVKKLVTTKLLNDVVKEIDAGLSAVNANVAKELYDKRASIASGYTDSVKSIESDIAGIIKKAADSLRVNAFGNYVTNPDHAWTDAGKAIARHNRQVIDNLISDVKKVDVTGHIKKAEGILVSILQDVRVQYTDVRDKTLNMIDALVVQVERTMDDAYSDTRLKYSAEGDVKSFDKFYKDLFEQLKASIVKKMKGFADMARKMIQGNSEVSDALSAIISCASNIAVQLQSAYRDSEDTYINALRRSTLAGSDAFDKAALSAQADIPFFSPDAAKRWAHETAELLADMVLDRIPDAFDSFKSYVFTLNKTGMLGTLDVLDDIIAPNIQYGQANVQEEIKTLKAGKSEISSCVTKMFDEIQPVLDALKECGWADSEIQAAEGLYSDIAGSDERRS